MAFTLSLSVFITRLMLAVFPITATAASSSSNTGSYTLCQFFSSIPGVDYSSIDSTSMTLPLCPSSLLTYSYTIPPPSATTTQATATPSSSEFISICHFYSSIPGFPSPTDVISSMIGVPLCPSSLQHITYSYQQQMPLGPSSNNLPTATLIGGVAAAASTFTGAAARGPCLERVLLAGGAGGILAGAVGMIIMMNQADWSEF